MSSDELDHASDSCFSDFDERVASFPDSSRDKDFGHDGKRVESHLLNHFVKIDKEFNQSESIKSGRGGLDIMKLCSDSTWFRDQLLLQQEIREFRA